MKWRGLIPGWSRPKTPQAISAKPIIYEAHSPFTWTSSDAEHRVEFVVDLRKLMQSSEWDASGWFEIVSKDYKASGKIYFSRSCITIDISEIWVPPAYKRKGLGTAFLVATEQAVNVATNTWFTGGIEERLMNIEGCFGGEGIGFASALCRELPTPGHASSLHPCHIQRAKKQLRSGHAVTSTDAVNHD